MTRAFPASSRYADIEVATLTLPDGTRIVHLRRRFAPPSDRFELLEEHSVASGDRLDNVAALYFDDPEQFWRICDANDAMRPEELIETAGRRLRITLPEGIAGPKNA